MSNIDAMRNNHNIQVRANQIQDLRKHINSGDEPIMTINSETKTLFEEILKYGFCNMVNRKQVGLEQAADILSSALEREVTPSELVKALEVMLLAAVFGSQSGQSTLAIVLTYGATVVAKDLPQWVVVATLNMPLEVIDYCKAHRNYFKFDTTLNVAALQFDREFKTYRQNRDINSRKQLLSFQAVAMCFYDYLDQPELTSTKKTFDTTGLLETVRFNNGRRAITFTTVELAVDDSYAIDDASWETELNFLAGFGWEHKQNGVEGVLLYNKHLPNWAMVLCFGGVTTPVAEDNPDTLEEPSSHHCAI